MFQRNETYLLYNSISNSFASLTEEDYNLLSECAAKSDISAIDEELMEDLHKMKAVDSNDDFEISKLRYANLARRFSNSHLSLTINPTLGCNFGCPYCFEGDHKTSPRMTDEVEDAIIEFIKRHKLAKALSVTWFGGEPLMEFQRIQTLTKKMLALDLDYKASIITNGYLFNEERAKALDELKIGFVQITLDGTRATHDARRYLKGGGPTFDRIIANIRLLAEYAPNTSVNIRVNLDEVNTDDFLNLYKYIQDMKLNNVSVHPAFVKDYGNCDNLCELDAQKQYAFIKDLYERHGIAFSSFYPSASRGECGIRNMNGVAIGPSGELYKCWNDVGKPEKVYGSITGGTTNEELLLEYLMDADPFDDPKCRKCILLPVCSGGCPYDRIQAKKNGEGDTCPLMKNHMDDYLWFHYLAKRKVSTP